MSDERLFEITSEISKTDDPLWIMVYVTSLSVSEICMFLKLVGNSKYCNLNIYESIFAFSYDYVKSRGVMIRTPLANVIDRKIDGEGNDIYTNSYFQSWADDKLTSDGSRIKR